MTGRLARIGFALLAPLILFGCVLTPGKFVSTLTMNADRSFHFAYKGEVIAINPRAAMKGMVSSPSAVEDNGKSKASMPTDDKADTTSENTAEPSEDTESKNREIAAALSKEYGYRSVVYQGKGKFLIDYAVSGTLTHTFIFPFNSDAEVVFPFLMIEVRQGGTVRVKAPGFANGSSSSGGAAVGMGGMAPMDSASKSLDGKFTVDTNAEIVSQNNEEGAKPMGGRGRKVISWRVTPLTKDAPTAVLRFAK